jgi:hypothetical protein
MIVSIYCLYVLKLKIEFLIYMVKKINKSLFAVPVIQTKEITYGKLKIFHNKKK